MGVCINGEETMTIAKLMISAVFVSADIDLNEFIEYMHNPVLRSAQELYELDEVESFQNMLVNVSGTINKEQLEMNIKR